MELHRQIAAIGTKEELADFVTALRDDLETRRDEWENPTLERFLSAMEAWIRSMDQYYTNTGQQPIQTPTWRTLADILYAAKIYE
jgi:hypothetical protein